ncbi:hypothetical protein POM88_050151 [Heracleum sosnowskyi]|uniref:adenine phosphoribosyltransferase n=1 Tax=Heracleum sosnowskyi TaxID=360622 RepID=A0AAD8M044_9APIA|nr:hypothetical protein POM88_050151 [Heracleum sosnowskyi]
MFQDIMTLLLDHKAFKLTIDIFVDRYRSMNISAVAGVEARGFMFGPPIALAIGTKFIPLRKPRKLPDDKRFDGIVVESDGLVTIQSIRCSVKKTSTSGCVNECQELLSSLHSVAITLLSLSPFTDAYAQTFASSSWIASSIEDRDNLSLLLPRIIRESVKKYIVLAFVETIVVD